MDTLDKITIFLNLHKQFKSFDNQKGLGGAINTGIQKVTVLKLQL